MIVTMVSVVYKHVEIHWTISLFGVVCDYSFNVGLDHVDIIRLNKSSVR